MTLDGLEALVIKGRNKKQRKLNFIHYADDFIVTCSFPGYLRNEIKPDIERFLADSGLILSGEKTCISYINDRFNFLDFIFRKFKQKLIIKPERSKASALLEKMKALFNSFSGPPFHVLLAKLNCVLRGWAYGC